MTATPVTARLRAVTREVEADRDLIDAFDTSGFAWLHHRTRFVASGIAARVAPDDVERALGAMDVDDPVGLPGTGPIAVGALPFDPDAAGALVIPSRIAGELDGRAWITEIGSDVADPVLATRLPTRFSVVAPRSRAAWCESVERALDAITRGELEKVVLAREVLIEADSPFDVRDVLRHLVGQQPGSFVYAIEGFVGASPELLVRRVGTIVESRPVAGTSLADGEESLRALAAS
ncbi:MAG: chorismate-binding protein, partial [Acidimicrobiia bacterium]